MTHDFGKDEQKSSSEASSSAPLIDMTPEMQAHKKNTDLDLMLNFYSSTYDIKTNLSEMVSPLSSG